MAPGTDKSASLGIPNGARVASATMNITGQPYTTDGTDYPENVTVDVGNDGNIEWAFRGKGYGDLGRQNEFVSGGINTTMMVGANGTNSSYFHLPKDAEIVNANCTVKSMGGATSGTIYINGTAGGNTMPFMQSSYRWQWLWVASEIGASGILDKLALKLSASSATGSCTLSNFRMWLCNSPVTSLTTTFATNYGGSTPVKVIDSPSYILCLFRDLRG
jgi:hypothetical protein